MVRQAGRVCDLLADIGRGSWIEGVPVKTIRIGGEYQEVLETVNGKSIRIEFRKSRGRICIDAVAIEHKERRAGILIFAGIIKKKEVFGVLTVEGEQTVKMSGQKFRRD